MTTITLSPDDAQDLQLAARACERAQQAFELAVTRAKVPLLEATAARNALIDRLAEAHGLDPDRPMQFDAAARTLTQDPAASQLTDRVAPSP